MTAARSAGRLLRLELRHNVMRWLLPLLAGLFWLVIYRRAMTHPPSWSLRAMTMQTAGVSVFAPTVVAAAAWVGSREDRHGLADLAACTARPRWARQLAAWAATTGWAVAAYLGCVGVLYAATARQGGWGGPLWWPAAVGVASLPAFAALGFTAGALFPSRFTAPLAAIGVFFGLELGAQFIHGDGSPWQILPLVAGPWEMGSVEGAATFYRYLPDLPIAQVMFLAGLTAVPLGVLGFRKDSGGRWLRRAAATVAAAGLLVTGAAVTLAGTGRLDAHGMIAIPALHDASDDDPVRYTPVCDGPVIPICLHPAYRHYLPTVVSALAPVLGEIAGLPGAPVRISQGSTTYRQLTDNGIEIRLAGPVASGRPPTFQLLLPSQLTGAPMGAGELAAAVRTDAGRVIVAVVTGAGRDANPAQQAVTDAILTTFTTEDPQIEAAARRFAALPPAARHAWLMDNVVALRDGAITLEQLP